MTRFTYKIDKDFSVSIFDSENPTETGAPNIHQTHRPNGTTEPFESKEEAETFAKALISEMENPPVPKPRPVIDEIDAEIVE